jgi:alpha-galactosidase
MDVGQEYVDVTAAIAQKIAKQLDVPTNIESTTDRRRALEGADYVISTIRPTGIDTRTESILIGQKYGVLQIVGGETGASAAECAIKYMPRLLEIVRDMEDVCPDALLLHYSNPTSMLSWALNQVTPIRSIGMCHSVQGSAQELAHYIGAPFGETGHWVAGVNHQAWFLRFEWNGVDAYPLIRERMEDPEIYEQDIVRFEMMKFFGYFITESSHHNSEYVPYFRKNRELVRRFTNRRGYSAGSESFAPSRDRWKKRIAERAKTLREQAFGDAPIEIERGAEYVSGIFNAIETNEPFRFNGNVVNTGLITNLPQKCCVEVPCLVDNMGVHPCYVGDLPPQCAALNRNRIAGDELMVKGILEEDRKAIEQAIALDPLTAAVCTLDQIHQLTEEILTVLAPEIELFV